MSIERTNSSNANSFFLQIFFFSFSSTMLRSNFSESLVMETVPRRISLNSLHLAHARNLISQNFQSSCFPLKLPTLRFFSLIRLLLTLALEGLNHLGFNYCMTMSMSWLSKSLTLKHVELLLSCWNLLHWKLAWAIIDSYLLLILTCYWFLLPIDLYLLLICTCYLLC